MDPSMMDQGAPQAGANPMGLPEILKPQPFTGAQLPVQGPDPSVVTIDQVMALLRDDRLRGFRIDVETDSLIEADQQREKQQRTEFVQSVGEFIAKVGPIAQAMPPMAPLVGGLLQFAVRGFKVGQELEELIESTMHKAGMMLENPPPKSMPPEEQAKLQMAQMKAQAEIQKAQIGVQVAQIDGQSKVATSQAEVQSIQSKHQLELQALAQKHDTAMMQISQQHETSMAQMAQQAHHDREKHQMAMAEHAAKLQQMQESHAQAIYSAQQAHEQKMQSAQQGHEMTLQGKHVETESKKQLADVKAKSRAKPEEKPSGPKKIIRDPKTRKVMGIEVGGKMLKAVRDETGRIVAVD